MKAKCWPGCVAEFIPPAEPAIVGKRVVVLQAHNSPLSLFGIFWEIQALQPMMMRALFEGRDEDAVRIGVGIACDDVLRPIEEFDDPDEIVTEQKKPEALEGVK